MRSIFLLFLRIQFENSLVAYLIPENEIGTPGGGRLRVVLRGVSFGGKPACLRGGMRFGGGEIFFSDLGIFKFLFEG